MKIKQNTTTQNFGNLYIMSNEANKLLRKADKAIKASNANFVNTNIPEGHKRPLWSVLSELVIKRQENNPNNILIDIADKAKQLLSVKTFDKKGYLINKYEVNPLPVEGTHNEIFPTNDLYRRYKNSLDQKLYGKSDFFEVIDRAEYEVDQMLIKQLENTNQLKVSLKELPKVNKRKKSPETILNPRRIEKARLKIVAHFQKPFENLRNLLNLSEKNKKLQPKNKQKLPRKIKKQTNKNI